MDLSLLLVTSLAVFTATVVQSVAGFGYAIIAVPIMSTIIGIKAAVIFILISGNYLRLLMLRQVWHETGWQSVRLLLFGAMLGSIPGSLILKFVDADTLRVGLGLTLIMAVVLMQCKFRWHTIHKKFEQLCFGFIGGIFSASTSVGGPPIALYMLNAERPKENARADMVLYFILSNCWTLTAAYVIGNADWHNFIGLPLWSLPAGFLGLYVGEKLFRRINTIIFHRLALLMVLASALTMLYKGLNL